MSYAYSVYDVDKELKHEISRVRQFRDKARDDQHFKQLILNRAVRCGPEKRERFVRILTQMGREDLANFVRMTFKDREGVEKK